MGKSSRKAVRESLEMTVSSDVRSIEPQTRRPVRVKLRPMTCDQGKLHPPAEDHANWWQRLKRAFGTESSDFVDMALFQLQLATRPYGAAVSEPAINAALAMIEAWAPGDAAEAAMALQAACTHSAAMAVLCRARGANGSDRQVAAMTNAASKLLSVSLAQVEYFRRLKHGNAQSIRVEHVHVHNGAQAVIGNVSR